MIMDEDNKQPTSKTIIVLTVIVVVLFPAAVIWVATLGPGQMVWVMFVILFIYFGWRFLFG